MLVVELNIIKRRLLIMIGWRLELSWLKSRIYRFSTRWHVAWQSCSKVASGTARRRARWESWRWNLRMLEGLRWEHLRLVNRWW
jgi:hypothetical protein